MTVNAENDMEGDPIKTLHELKPGTSSQVRFQVTDTMVRRFAELIEDRSFLHSSGEFARRSMYRQQVVHGMLPIGFLSHVNFLNPGALGCSLIELSGNFIEPVHIGDKLQLHATAADFDEADSVIACHYYIKKDGTGRIVARGKARVRFSNLKELSGSVTSGEGMGAVSVLEERLPLARDLKLEDISLNDSDTFSFRLSENGVHALLRILNEGFLKENGMHVPDSTPNLFPELLAVMLFSSSVGMCIPGRYATFMAFQADIKKRISLNRSYFLRGTVTHVSRSTRIIKKEISICNAEDMDLSVSGKVSALVNTPPPKMPAIKALRESALDMGLRGKVILVTGASRGIGETTAKLFSLHGSKVVVNFYRGREDAGRIVEEILSAGGDAISVQADVSDRRQVAEMVKEVVEKYRTVDVLVNNAVRDFRPVAFEGLSWDDIRQDLDVILRGTFNCCKEVIPLMAKQRHGKIINIGTVASDDPPPNQVKYVIAKSGLVGLTRSLSIELAPKKIQVNMVVPSFVDTDLVSHIPDVYKNKIAGEVPMGRIATPVDIAQAVVFLASSHCSYTTGQRLFITGGGGPYS